MDQFAHISLGSRLGCGPRHMPCRDHSNHDRREIVGKRTAMDRVWELHDKAPAAAGSQGEGFRNHSNRNRRKTPFGPHGIRRKFLVPPVNAPSVIPLNGLKGNGLN